MTKRSHVYGLGAALLLSACGDAGGARTDSSATEPGPFMRPGENCLRCHSPTSDTGAPIWTAGGTVFARKDADRDEGVPGALVVITGANGERVELTTNAAGNFYTRKSLTKPYRVAITYEGRTKEMPVDAPAGSCNACHSWPDPSGGAPGRIYVP
jgi:hypothetical protein